MKFLILGAMDQEIALLTKSLANSHISTVGHLECHTGEFAGHELIIARCGIGKVASALAVGVLAHEFKPDVIINTGSAGGYAKSLAVGDIVIADELVQFDVDLTNFGYTHGQPAGMPARFNCDSKLIANALAQVKAMPGINGIKGLIGTSDKFICEAADTQHIAGLFPEIAAVEMEGAAIAQACHMLNIKCLVIRSISDLANEASTHTFEEYLEQAAKHSAQLVMAVITAA